MSNQAYNVSEAIKAIKSVAYALDNLEVKGRKNLDILLGSIQALDRSAGVIESAFKQLDHPVSEPEVTLEIVPEGEEQQNE